jgi:hypothetical protein|uniref:Uncharacterized protein n=1 Tax=Picea glauca TaxID=3330 RepID=A0A101M1H9_PICGL|nr:hypothetical protein ABT39_MTgene3736 [Picea glauca]QHR87382.1 hypothetical protein Q903MT_gene1392 [Picea sitchensis]
MNEGGLEEEMSLVSERRLVEREDESPEAALEALGTFGMMNYFEEVTGRKGGKDNRVSMTLKQITLNID